MFNSIVTCFKCILLSVRLLKWVGEIEKRFLKIHWPTKLKYWIVGNCHRKHHYVTLSNHQAPYEFSTISKFKERAVSCNKCYYSEIYREIKLVNKIDFQELLAHFCTMQEKHRKYKHQKIKQRLQSSIEPTVKHQG